MLKCTVWVQYIDHFISLITHRNIEGILVF